MAGVFNATGKPQLQYLISEKLRRQQFTGNVFGQWVGPQFVKAGGGTEEVVAVGPEGATWTGAPIETVDAFINDGGTAMQIPIANRLTDDPVHGDVPLRGTEESAKITFRTVKINRTRKAYAIPTGMNFKTVQRFTARKLVANASNMLQTWMNDWIPTTILMAFLVGFSRDLVAAKSIGGAGVAYVSHPNMLVAGHGEVSYGAGRPGTTGYEESVESAVNGMTDSAECRMSVAFVRNMVAQAPRKKIYRIVTKEGYKFYPIFMKDSAFAQLQADPEFQELAKSLKIENMAKHPLANNAVAFIGDAAIFVDNKFWCIYTNQDDANIPEGTVQYGPRPTAAEYAAGKKIGNAILNFDMGTKACCILVGQSAVTVGTGEEVSMKEDVQDYENVKGLGLDYIQTMVRSESYDDLGMITGLNEGDFYENTSSIVGVTWSPWDLSWN